MITCNQLKQACHQVFTYSAQYQAPFYGREASIREMEEKTANLQPGKTLIISQPLGTGKTFLVNHMITDGKLPVPRGVEFLTARGVSENPSSLERFPGDVLVVDETDIKTTYKKLELGLDRLQEYVSKTGKKAIVIGDFLLRNKNLQSRLDRPDMIQEFENLDRAFFRGALEQRFRVFLGDFLDPSFAVEDVIDPALLELLTPDWMCQVNSFRGVFSLLQSVVRNDKLVKYNSSRAYLELSMVMEHLKNDNDDPFDNEEQRRFLELLREYIREVYPKGSGITRGFDLDELYQLAENDGMEIDYDDFAEEILYPLATKRFLVSTGIPVYEDGEFIRRPLPMVPSLKLLLSTLD